MHEGLPITDHHQVISVDDLSEWLKGVSEHAYSILEYGQSIIFLHKFQRDLLVKLGERVKFLHGTVLEIRRVAADGTTLLDN